MREVEKEDLGDRWRIVVELDGGRRLEVVFPKSIDSVDVENFREHLMTLATKGPS
jgi:hypothetical protein